jgi:hypothetical protein
MLTPVTILGPERIADVQQADLLVRCRDDDYHVDRSIMCHHSQWFAKVYSKVNYPVCQLFVYENSWADKQ